MDFLEKLYPKRDLKRNIWRDWISIVIPPVTLIVTIFFFNNINSNAYKYSFRPYIGVQHASLLQEPNKLECVLILKNSGRVPANNIRSSGKHFLDGVLQPSENKDFSNKSIIFPDGEIEVRHYIIFSNGIEDVLRGKLIWEIGVTILYDGIKSGGHTTQVLLRYNKDRNLFDILSGNAK